MLSKFLWRFLFVLSLTIGLQINVLAKVNTSPLFVQISDAMSHVKKGENQQILPILQNIKKDFVALQNHDSIAGKTVSDTIEQALKQQDLLSLESLSKALYTFEKEQNPVDYEAKRQQFSKRVVPVYEQLNKHILEKNLDAVIEDYKRFNTTWTLNEKAVRDTSIGHYGQIETAMTLMRIAMLADPPNYLEMEKQSAQLKNTLDDFKAGNTATIKVDTNAPTDLASGIGLLSKSYDDFANKRIEEGQAKIRTFIQQWPIFEGEVRTRNGSLYSKVESLLPVILLKADEPANLQKFTQLITELKQINVNAAYGPIDAALVLLREGVEALLIVMALVTTLNAAKQITAKRWVYAGAILGVFASLLGAIALQQLFPTIAAGTNREILEGSIGIIAVIIMLFVGAWLHSKASITGWRKFVDKHVNTALATGSLFSMLALSFLSVFREGAETILFYAGMLPRIELQDLLLGIGIALIALLVIAILMITSSKRLPMHHLFKVMTWLIYTLGFKILGVSIHSLQLTNILPEHLLASLPSIPLIGFYANWECIVAQVLYLALIPLVNKLFK
ncbi:FTR1 family iron permease [Pelistega indica]|uniref:FTR1 family iron permease n=1 Tax=Pelistega indica TaxID=1414851 RepID=V8GBJ3_9BURK|nr:FTR1 family protein [Pelistega indica]ETD73103.1 FTR1 family iron permease [Pelistega indica]